MDGLSRFCWSQWGGEERGGDACITLPGKRAPTMGDASIPSPLLTSPAPTRADASEDAAHGDSYQTYPRAASPLVLE